VPRLCGFYRGICLTTEEKAGEKTSVRVVIRKHTMRIRSRNNKNTSIILSNRNNYIIKQKLYDDARTCQRQVQKAVVRGSYVTEEKLKLLLGHNL
jgi:outer membrane lipoprotein-sorting protein